MKSKSISLKSISRFLKLPCQWKLFESHVQLQMRLTSLGNIKAPKLPPEYQIRTYARGDEKHWMDIIRASFGIEYPVDQAFDEIVGKKGFDPNSLFFLTYHEQPVGTICAQARCIGGHKSVYLHMLGIVPTHQGEKLGRLLALFALDYLKRKGFQDAILDTDDYRLPAIRTYIDIGFEPVYLDQTHKKRWTKVLAEIATTHN